MPVYVILGFVVLFFVLEQIVPGRKQPYVRSWHVKAVFINTLQIGVIALLRHVWDEYLDRWSVIDLSSLTPLWGGFVSFLIAGFVLYWWHRLRHRSQFFWTWHQLHHSSRRLDVLCTFYKHPLEFGVAALIVNSVSFTLLGLSFEAAAWSFACFAIPDSLAHSNLKTPRWVGFFTQRPEMHRIHHEFERHASNFGMVWLDALFGTYRNPVGLDIEHCGFEAHRESRFRDMLMLKDVHAD